MKRKIAPSLMCMDMLKVREQLEFFNNHADYLHVDIMDGHFAKNLSLSPYFVKNISQIVTIPMDVHLMVTNPADYIDICADAGANIISPHAECINTDAFRIIRKIQDCNCKVGVVLNPATPLSYIQEYINKIDIITFMTVDVGFAGQPFIHEMLDKIKQAVRLRDEKGYHFEIQVDGGCKQGYYKMLCDAGTEIYIIGNSGLFALDPDISIAWNKMKNLFDTEIGIDGKENG